MAALFGDYNSCRYCLYAFPRTRRLDVCRRSSLGDSRLKVLYCSFFSTRFPWLNTLQHNRLLRDGRNKSDRTSLAACWLPCTSFEIKLAVAFNVSNIVYTLIVKAMFRNIVCCLFVVLWVLWVCSQGVERNRRYMYLGP